MTKRCLMTTPAIEELAIKLQGETVESVKGLVALWQEEHNKDWDTYPSAKELAVYREKLRNNKSVEDIAERNLDSFNTPTAISLEQQNKLDLEFSMQTRRDRVSLIARLFSQEIDFALQEHKESLDKRIERVEAEGDFAAGAELRLNKAKLDRYEIIKVFSPAGLFRRIGEGFQEYVNKSFEEQVEEEISILKSQKGIEKYSEEQIRKAAEKNTKYKVIEYNKLLDNFQALAEEASRILLQTEGIRVDPNYLAPKEADLNDDDPEGESASDRAGDMSFREEMFKDGWMTHYDEVSSHESLSQRVRKMIREIPRLNYKGMFDKDDLGNQRFLDPDYVHATLIDKLRTMISAKDMIPLLEELQKQKPWIKMIIKELESDMSLFSQFYQDFRKDFIPYWIQKKKLQPDGTYQYSTISVNKPEGVYYLLDQWRDNYETGNILDDDSIYGKTGELILDNAAKGLKWTEALNNKFSNLSSEQGVELIKTDKVWKTINKLLNMIGIDANPGVLMDALTNLKKAEGVKFTDPITLLLEDLNIIFSGVQKGKVKVEESEDGIKREDLINSFGSAYNSIALMLAEVTEDAIESSVRENGRTQYSHVNPNYLGKLINQLKNVNGDKAAFDKFIQQEFGQYEWFYKNGKWMSDWLYQLVNDPEARKGLEHKVLLNADKIEYQDWDPLDYTLVLLTEYFSNPENTTSGTQWAYYHLPILADTPSAEFLRFKKYTNKSIIGEDGQFRRYDDIILDKMVDLVNQEMDRIALVVQRDIDYRKGNPAVAPIANFDITRDKEGKIKSKGGSEFKFLPALNTLKSSDGKTFLENFQEIQENGTGEELRNFIKESLMKIMDDEFEKSYKTWYKMGLFNETKNGDYKYLGMLGVKKGQSGYDKVTAKALYKASQILGENWTKNMAKLLKYYNKGLPVDNRTATTIFNQIKEALGEKMDRGEITLSEYNGLANNLEVRNTAKEKLREYFYNSKFATSQIIQLTTTDLAFYKDLEDFQKRFKEVHAPSVRLNILSKYGREFEKTIYLADQEIVSNTIKDAEEVLRTRLSKKEADSIIEKLKKVNVADGQAYRSLSSYRAILDMSGQWTDAMQKAFDNFQNGTWSMEDFNIIWQPKKPYVYTQINNISGIEGHTGIKTPVQHKNSEFLLMAMYSILGGPLGKSAHLRALNEFMEEKGIDVVQFESTTKVGKQGVFNKALHELQSVEEIKKMLNDYAFPNGEENPNVVHTIPYEDYGIQVETPEHIIDTIQLVGTQIRKLITADISDDVQITIGNKTMTKAEWLKLYNAIITENIMNSFIEVYKIFSSPKEVEKALLEELRGSQRYGMDMIKACTLDENGNFNIPLFDPVQSQRVQSLLNSIIKNRVTKQKIKGGALIQVTAYGLSDQLNILYEGEGENKRIVGFECFMPAYSRQFYEPLMKEGTHELDITKLPENLRRLIGYRVPTEDKYSMIPLIIKGFLPQQNGSSIILPADITTLTGSDFDIDKLYVMLPEFKVNSKYDKEGFAKDLITEWLNSKGKKVNAKSISKYLDGVMEAIDKGKFAKEGSDEYYIWEKYQNEKSKYLLKDKTTINKVEYDYSKSAHENGLAARNNALIDLMWGILTNSDTAEKMLNPGGFDDQKDAAKIVTILNSAKEKELRASLGIDSRASIYKALRNSGSGALAELASLYKESLDPLSPTTQVALHQRNMTGANMIGIYANHNANHALIQHTMLALDEENGQFRFNGRTESSLHQVKSKGGRFISKMNAGFLAAAVDNAKDPVLGVLNQNTLTADLTMLLSRLGYEAYEIGLLLNQPIIMDITQEYFRQSREGKSKNTIIDEVIDEYREKAGMMESVTYENYRNNKFEADELADNIIIAKEMDDLESANDTDDYRKVSFYKRQVAVGYLFKRMMAPGDALGQLVQATRSDTQGGAAGPTIADTQVKMMKVQDFIDNVVNGEHSPLIGANILLNDIKYEEVSEEELRESLLNSPLPFLQAFYTLGLQAPNKLLSKYFPQLSDSFTSVVQTLRMMTKLEKLDAKTINNIYNDLLAYIMSKTKFFGQEVLMSNGEENKTKVLSNEDKRRDFINNFPEYFNNIVGSNPEIAELGFIKRLRVIRAGAHNPVDVLVFKNVGKLTPNLREEFMKDWQALLYMGPEAVNLALNLFRYSSYRNGFAFGPNSFIHLAPVAVRKAVPEYIETLRGLTESEDDYKEFVYQYIYNHLDNRRFTPEIKEDANIRFLNNQQEPLQVIEVHVDKSQNSATKEVVRKQINIDGEPSYEFFEFIARKHKDGFIYYRLMEYNEGDATYAKIEPLGYKNSFIEYEYGKEVSEMKSAIKRNENKGSIDTSEFQAFDDDVDYDNMPDYINQDYNYEYGETVQQAAFKEVYDSPYEENLGESNNFDTLEPNTEYRDAKNDKLC